MDIKLVSIGYEINHICFNKWALQFSREDFLKSEDDDNQWLMIRDATFFYSLAAGRLYLFITDMRDQLVKVVKEHPECEYLLLHIRHDEDKNDPDINEWILCAEDGQVIEILSYGKIFDMIREENNGTQSNF